LPIEKLRRDPEHEFEVLAGEELQAFAGGELELKHHHILGDLLH
jgi:hypothetical protein